MKSGLVLTRLFPIDSSIGHSHVWIIQAKKEHNNYCYGFFICSEIFRHVYSRGIFLHKLQCLDFREIPYQRSMNVSTQYGSNKTIKSINME